MVEPLFCLLKIEKGLKTMNTVGYLLTNYQQLLTLAF